MCAHITVDISAIESNSRELVTRLNQRGISVTGVTKAVLGDPEIARAMLRGGVKRLGDSRIENIEQLRSAGIRQPITLMRSPEPALAHRAIKAASQSLVSDIDIAAALGKAASLIGLRHGVVMMVELGDLREGVMLADAETFARQLAAIEGLVLMGLGTNLACRSGHEPSEAQMVALDDLAQRLAPWLGVAQPMVSGGNSANLRWALGGASVGGINDLRLGESLLLGVDPLTRERIPWLSDDAFVLHAAVIESIAKPAVPWWPSHEPRPLGAPFSSDTRIIIQTIVALGRQDVDAEDLIFPAGMTLLAQTGDHLMVETDHVMVAGTDVPLQLTYQALLKSMTSPFVQRIMLNAPALIPAPDPPVPPKVVDHLA